VIHFLLFANRGDWENAAHYLDAPAGADGRTLAKQLKAVLDRHLYIRLETLSPNPEGFEDDNLPAGVEQLGTIPGLADQPEPVWIVRKDRPTGPVWLFSRSTLSRVPGWYGQLSHRALRENLPSFFFRMGAKGLLFWQWILVIVGFPLLLLAGRGAGWALQKLLLRAAAKTPTTWDETLAKQVAGPLSLAAALVLAYFVNPLLGPNDAGAKFLSQVITALGIFCMFWTLFRIIKAGAEITEGSTWARTNPSAPAVLSIGVRSAQIMVIVLGVLAAISQLGFPVGSALAGLGLGGLAFALAAQKTVENVFGSVSIGVDQPFRVGDFVNVGGLLGTVESIGLRSTRIRTLDRTIITFPNGKLADREIETFGARDRFRLALNVTLEYKTTSAQVRQIMEGLREVLATHPKIWPDEIIVSFLKFGESSLDIEVAAWFLVPDMPSYRQVRQDVLLQFMEVVEKAGTSFAFPSRTLYLRKDDEVALR
jgi:MscS family membrane protein